MTDLSRDPIINIVHNGIKRGISVVLENKCFGASVILIYSGIDAMAYLGTPCGQEDVRPEDFVDWAERYIRFPCQEQLTGLDLYGARCAMLHTYSTTSRLSRKRKCRQVGYVDKSVPEVIYEPQVSTQLVMISIEALKEAFFHAVDRFLMDLFSDPERAKAAEECLSKLVTQLPYKPPPHAGQRSSSSGKPGPECGAG